MCDTAPITQELQGADRLTALDAFLDEMIRRAGVLGYHPKVFISMRQRHGTIAAISKPVQSGDLQTGFKRLNGLGMLDWTIEAAVVKFSNLFSRDDLECAEFRLRMARGGDHA